MLCAHDDKRDFGRCSIDLFTKCNRKFKFFCMNFFEISNQIIKWQGSLKLKHRLTCDYCAPCAKFEVIWTMLARWINGPHVANWGWGRHMTDSTSYLNYIYDRGLVEKRLFIHIYYFSWRIFDTHICHKVKVNFKRFLDILKYYEYILEGLVKLDQSLWIACETFRLVQMVFCG